MKELLPLGSVVTLGKVKKRIMIFGRNQQGSNGKTYDYVGCPYPEGNIAPEESVLFNQSDVSMIFFIGFQDIEELQFKETVSRKEKDEAQ